MYRLKQNIRSLTWILGKILGLNIVFRCEYNRWRKMNALMELVF